MKAIVMAGGFGTRIQPLTNTVPKPMLSLLNRPMMEHIILKLKGAGITEIVVLLYHLPDVIRDHFGDGKKFGVTLHYVLPDDDFGTAGAVKKAQHLIDDTFIVMSGDLVTDFDLGAVMAFHREKKTPVTITLTSVPNPLEFGVVITDKTGRILRFLEKPGWGEVFSDTINTGIYIFEPEVFNLIPEGRAFDFSKDLFPIYMKDETPIYGFNAKGYWRDVGNPDSYREAVGDILGGVAHFTLPGKMQEVNGGHVWMEGRGVLPASLAVSGKVVLGKGVRLGKEVSLKDCVLGDYTSVGDGARLSNVVTWVGVKVGAGSIMRDTVLCDRVITGAGVKMKKGAIVAERTEVGEKVTFEKDIMVWPDKKIEAGATLSANMVWGDKWKKSVLEGGIVRGNTNIELSPEFAAKMGAALGSILPQSSSMLVSRDYLRSSRMLKRAFLGGILSTGVNVHDVKMCPVPVARYKLAGFGEEAGVHFQQSGAGERQTEIAFYDEEGNLADSGREKSIERLFFKENFRRVAHSEVGAISELAQIPDFYREGFMRAIDAPTITSRRFRVVLDLGFGTSGDYLPGLLNQMGCQPVVLNAYPDERRLSRRSRELPDALSQLSEIVKTLGADVGFCLSPGGTILQVIDDKGAVRPAHQTAMAFLHLLCAANSDGVLSGKSGNPVRVFLPVTEPRIMDDHPGLRITRGKTASLRTSEMHDCDFIVSGEGQYSFPDFLHTPDAMFAVAKMLELLAKTGLTIGEVFEALPSYSYITRPVACPVEKKGLIMRRMSEDSVDKEATFIDGIQVFSSQGSVLLLPDPHRPVLHLVAEASSDGAAEGLIKEYEKKVAGWLES